MADMPSWWPFGGGNDQAAQDAALATAFANSRAGAGSGGGNSISAPQGQQNVLIPNTAFNPKKPVDADNWPWVGGPSGLPSPNAAAKPSTTAPSHFGSNDVGYWIVDPAAPNGVRMVVPPNTPNADEEMNKAMTREQNEQLRRQRQNNEAAGFGYATDDEVTKRTLDARRSNLDEKKYLLDFKDSNEKQRQFDIQQAAKDKVDAANIGLTKASTARTGAETQQILGTTERTAALLPGEIEQQGATLASTIAGTEGTQASTAATKQATQIAGAPKVQEPGKGMSQWTYNPLTGKVEQGPVNPEYIAKTPAEIAARAAQMSGLMNQKGAEVQGKIGQVINGREYTADDASKEFNTWYDQNIAGQRDALLAAQQDQAFQQAKDMAAMRTNAYNAANAAATQAVNAHNAMARSAVGANFQDANAAASRGDFKALGGVEGGGTGWTGPNLQDTMRSSVQDALKYIDPTAAQAAGRPMPNYAGLDIGAALSPTQYNWGGGSGALPGVGAAPAPVAPPAPSPEDEEARRLAAIAASGGTGGPRADQMWGGALPGNLMGNTRGMPGGWVDPALFGKYTLTDRYGGA